MNSAEERSGIMSWGIKKRKQNSKRLQEIEAGNELAHGGEIQRTSKARTHHSKGGKSGRD